MTKRPDADARFDAKWVLHPETGCMLWIGARNGPAAEKYGSFRFRGKMMKAHRYAYERDVGPIPPGLDLDHKCRVRRCVSSDHLEPVTRKENVRRGRLGPGMKTHCKYGHPLSGGNLTTIHRPRGVERRCKACHCARQRRYSHGD